MSGTAVTDIRIVPTGGALGADIVGFDLRQDIGDAEFRRIEDAWHDHLVLRFRGQALDDDALAAFSRRFGELDMAPTGRGGKPFNPDRPEIVVVSNIVVDGKPAGALGNSELVWHQDMTYNDVPPKASLLYGIEVPEDGRCHAVLQPLQGLRRTAGPTFVRRIAGLRCKHDATRSSDGRPAPRLRGRVLE